MGWGRLADWKVLAVGVEVVVAGACLVLGWHLVHGQQGARAVTIRSGAPAPAPAILGIPGMPARSTEPRATAAKPPGLREILQRINGDDARLYRGQWATIQVLAHATRDYVERHILPLLLAAARGGSR